MQTKPALLTYEEASKYIRNKPSMVEALSRDGWLLPSIGSPVCSLDFLDLVRRKVVYCPRRSELTTVKKCFSHPPKAVLYTMFIEACSAKFQRGEIDEVLKIKLENLITVLKSKEANVDFYLLLMNVIAPDWEGFSKSYIYRRNQEEPIEPEIDNTDQL